MAVGSSSTDTSQQGREDWTVEQKMDVFSKENFFRDEAPGTNVAKFYHLLEERIWWSEESEAAVVFRAGFASPTAPH